MAECVPKYDRMTAIQDPVRERIHFVHFHVSKLNEMLFVDIAHGTIIAFQQQQVSGLPHFHHPSAGGLCIVTNKCMSYL
jgi:hypothetical protein